MAQLTRNSYFKNLLANEVFTGDPTKVDAEYNTLKVTIETDEDGVLSVFQSIDSQTYNTYGDVFNISGRTHKQIHIKGRYVYVRYQNGAFDTGNFTLYSVLSKSVATEVGISEVLVTNNYLDVSGSVSVNGLLFDASGNLKVSGGVSSDVNVTNFPATQDVSGSVSVSNFPAIQDVSGSVSVNNFPAIQDVSGSVSVSNFPATQDVSGSVSVTNFPAIQDTHDVSAVELLSYIRDNVFSIDSNTTIIETQPVHLDLENDGATVWADSTLPWIAPPNGEDGWAYINDPSGGAQLYYYANAPALNPLSVEASITLGSVATGWFIGNQKLLTNSDNRFNMAIYTQPTGSGDAQPWYKSRRVYQALSDKSLSKGVDYFFYWGTDITLFHKELTHIELSLVSQEGTLGSNEIVEFMSVNVPSNVASNAFNGVVKRAGYVSSVATREVIFDNSVEKKAETQLGKLDVSGGELLVKDSSANDKLGQFSFLDDGYGNKELRVLVRNPSDIGVSVNNQVTVGLAEFSSVGITAGSEVGLASGTQVALVSGTEVALVSGTTVAVSGDVAITSATALSVTETAPITGFALETTQQDVYARLHDVSGNVGITGSVQTHCFASSNGTDWHHLASDANGRIITNSRNHDGLGNDITSTVNGAKRGLDVSLIDEVVVTKSYNTNTIANNVSVTGPQQIGTAVEIGGYEHIGAQIDIASVSSPGNIYMEFSIDNNQYIRFSSDMTTSYYAMSAMAQQIGGIKVSNSPFRYIRLYADTGLSATGVTIKVITK